MRTPAVIAATLVSCSLLAFADVTLVEDGQARAAIVIPAEPLPVEQYAADELAYHVERATGVLLPIATEADLPEAEAYVFIGATKAAAEAGIDTAALAWEETVLRTEGNRVIIAGQDEDGDPLSTETSAGTLWGVYELLERDLGVVWMWPGELGTHVPQTDSVVFRPELAAGMTVSFTADGVRVTDERFEPWLLQRGIRAGNMMRGEPPTQRFTPEARAAYLHDQSVFVRRHRMGRNHPLSYGHAFNSWWDSYGAEHPEWFQLVNDRRGPRTQGSRFSMCVSDPGFHERVIANWLEAREANPGSVFNINVCENDIQGLCECDVCTSWDGPQPESINPRFGPRVVSDRYAKFWGIICDKAMAVDPNAIVMAYAYVNYAPAPSEGIELPPNMLIGSVPDIFFPRTEAEQQWTLEQWDGWAKTGATLFLRPNYTLHGYVMPHIQVHQFAEEFQHEAENGMRATDFDSLNGQWSTQGTNLYALMRLHTRPGMDIDEMLAEYYSGFGMAAAEVKRYFDFFEEHVTALRSQPEYLETNSLVNWTRYAGSAHRIFPEEVLAEGAAILQRAMDATEAQQPYAERVRFLQVGLEHARLCAEVARLLAGEDAEVSPFGVNRRLEELAAFRREHEALGFSYLDFAAFIEERSWEISRGYSGEQVRAVGEGGTPAEGAYFSLRGVHPVVAVLEAGDSFRAHIETKMVGGNAEPITWVLVSPADEVLERGSIPVGESAEIDLPVPSAGTWALVVQTSGNNARVTPLNEHSAVAAPKLGLIYATSPVYFDVPEGTQEFTLSFYAMYPAEQIRVRVFGPDGNEVATAHTERSGEMELPITVGAGQDGKAWSVAFEEGEGGVWEDYVVKMDPDLPAYWSLSAGQVVGP